MNRKSRLKSQAQASLSLEPSAVGEVRVVAVLPCSLAWYEETFLVIFLHFLHLIDRL